MARLARIVIPDLPHHVVQRARPGLKLFSDESDYAEYRDMLESNLRGARLVSACLMPDHVHLIAIPSTGEALARMLGETRRLYARYKGLGPQGLWRGRYLSCPLDTAHAKAALAYLSFNPVRAGLVRQPAEWKWLLGEQNFDAPADDRHVQTIRASTRTGRPAGDADFYARIEYELGRSLRPKKRGRKARW
ncbi:MAG TPA: transposase [Nordella sp.]|nr:transposase [Nordella sp.]